MSTFLRFLILLGLASLAACAGIRQRDGEPSALTRYLEYAGEPIPSFSTMGRVDAWRGLSRTQLVVWTRLDDANLLTADPTCRELQFAMNIALESRVNGTSSSGFDHVRAGRDRCQIVQIRPIDYRLMKQEERALREEAGRSG